MKITILEFYVFVLCPPDYKSYSSLYLWECLAYTKSTKIKTANKFMIIWTGSNAVRNLVYKITLISRLDLPTKWYPKGVYLNYIWRIGKVKNIYYRHGIAWILPIHKLDFHCYISGRTLTIGKIEALRVYVEKISVKAIVYTKVNTYLKTLSNMSQNR